MKVTRGKRQVTGNRNNAIQRGASSCHVSRVTCQAFTLLEIMLAIAIFSFVMAAIYSSWMLILRAKKVGEEATAQVQRRRMAVWTIEDALMCAQSFQASIKYYTFIVQNGEDPMLSFTARLPDNFPRNGEFGDFNLRRVTFSVETGPNSEPDLVLRQDPILMDMSQDEQEHPLVLARNVKKFVVDCWDPREGDWSDEWDDTNQIPRMVRFTLSSAETKATTILVTTPARRCPSRASWPFRR